ncbi:hypothetical protein [Mycobacterium sp. SMC-8]|nr:hypothetical protein [Mycobacterium sp. SMC-8]
MQFKPISNFGVAAAISTRQHDAGPKGQPSSTVAPPNPALQFSAF